MTYLDPKADLTFKKVFGEHEELVKSLLNALLPFQTRAGAAVHRGDADGMVEGVQAACVV